MISYKYQEQKKSYNNDYSKYYPQNRQDYQNWKNRFKGKNLFEEIREHNSIINQKLNEIEANFKENKKKADKEIEDFKNKIKAKDIEFVKQKELNKNLVEENEKLNNKISELNKKCKELEEKIKSIKMNQNIMIKILKI